MDALHHSNAMKLMRFTTPMGRSVLIHPKRFLYAERHGGDALATIIYLDDVISTNIVVRETPTQVAAEFERCMRGSAS